MTSLVDTVTGAADWAAGSTDEAVGRQFDSTAGGGVVDYGTWAGLADNAAGSTDEWVGRTFDKKKGDGIGETAGQAADTAAGVGDFLAGSTDEWVGGHTGYTTLILVGIAVVVLGYVFRPLMGAVSDA